MSGVYRTEINIRIPRHSSTLGQVKLEFQNSLIIQCNTERSIWQVFVPLLLPHFENNENGFAKFEHQDKMVLILDDNDKEMEQITHNAINFVSCLMNHFSIFQQQKENCFIDKISTTISKDTKEEESWTSTRILMRRSLNTALIDGNIDIVLLPPNPSPVGNLRAEKAWSSALIALENLLLRLISLNAYIATLGGGYFLCRKLETAVMLAKQQRRVALALGDFSLAGQCTVNEAYNFIFAGHIEKALCLILTVTSDAKERNDELLLAKCKAARVFARRVRKAEKYVESEPNNILQGSQHNDTVSYQLTNSSNISSTFDDFQRIRIRQC